ncbi:MAG TPA: glutathione S-transferase family protein [Amaricoccus sp.]|nr:glutathione S-transferase family protein [Amaricoccus sp.]
MKLYMHPASITSRIVRLYIAEKGLAVEEEVVDLFSGAHHQEPFVTVNPNRLVPVLEDGDFRLTESAAILIYLAEKNGFPEYPADLALRARVNEVMFWASFNFYREWGYNLGYPQLFPHHKRATDEAHRVVVEWGRDKASFWLQVLDSHWLGDGRTWLTGEAITVADYYVGGLVALGDLIRWDFGKTPKVAAWLGRVKGLAAWGEVSAALDGFAASLKEREFVTG